MTCKNGQSVKSVMTLGKVVERLILDLDTTFISWVIRNVPQNLAQFETFRGKPVRVPTRIR